MALARKDHNPRSETGRAARSASAEIRSPNPTPMYPMRDRNDATARAGSQSSTYKMAALLMSERASAIIVYRYINRTHPLSSKVGLFGNNGAGTRGRLRANKGLAVRRGGDRTSCGALNLRDVAG